MRWRFLKLDSPYLIGELVIVVFGVLIALGIDSWRTELEVKAVEAEYLERLSEELSDGQGFLRDFLTRVETIIAAQDRLIVFLNQRNEPISWRDSVSDFAWSARLAGDESLEPRLMHDLTYQELINTGNFSLISNTKLRSSIAAYYQNLGTTLGVSAFVPRNLNARFTRSTGFTPGDYLRADEHHELVDVVNVRIVEEIQQSSSEILAELNESKAALGRSARWISGTLAANSELQSLIQESGRD